MENLNELAKKIHENAVKHGFYDEKREIGTLLMLCVSELSEALEADRKGRHANTREFNERRKTFDNLIKSLKVSYAKKDFETYVKDTFEDELADAIIRILDLCAYLDIDIEEHILIKMKYNEMRENKHGKRY